MTPWSATPARRAARWLLAAVLAIVGWSSAQAQNIESVLRPGDVIQGHAKWEEDCKSCHVKFDRDVREALMGKFNQPTVQS